MVDYEVPLTIKSINYTITSNSYNVGLDDDITITVKATDKNNRPIKGKVINLYQNGGFVDNETTGNDGIASFEIRMLYAGLQIFTVENYSIGVNVREYYTIEETNLLLSDLDEWTSIDITDYGTLYVNHRVKLCEFHYYRQFTSAEADHLYTWHTAAIPEEYRPPVQATGSFNQVGMLYVSASGDIGGKFANAWSTARNCNGMVTWHYVSEYD